MVEDTAGAIPWAGMVISVATCEDVVVMNPERFLSAARWAHRAENPEASEGDAAAAVVDVYDAVNARAGFTGWAKSPHR